MKYSIIIPTMWYSNYLKDMLTIYNRSNNIHEIILIDNNKHKRFEYIESPKIKLLEQEQNIYVNPAWNLGVSMAESDNIIIINDDILIDENDLEKLLIKVNETLKEKMVIGPHEYCFDNRCLNHEVFIDNTIKKFTYGWGTFMIMKKESYVKIPEDILIFFGDNIQHNNNEPYRFNGVRINTPMSTTLNADINLYNLGLDDHNKITKYIK
jgi:GT2 family glycosyltransferase